MSDVTPFVPIVLDLPVHNFYHWRHLCLVHLGRCSLRHHVEGDDAPALADFLWVKNDYAILQWIYRGISTELFHLVVRDGVTARDVWTALRDLFQDNRDARISQLHTELRTLAQGDNSASAYCQRVKAIGDELQELDSRVDDRGLVHALLNGLNERYAQVATLIPLLRLFPTFAEARSMLQLEDLNLARKARNPQAFHTNYGPSCAPGGGSSSGYGSANQQPRSSTASSSTRPPGVSPNYKGKNPIPGYQPQRTRSLTLRAPTPQAAPPRASCTNSSTSSASDAI
ncbi:uncharacterized protein LOC104582055 [Brachypodium distachyon]|uniref:uncharacterized protein LOC104582055 n=1 Tax=Brachypodium distachyon TaxID=15368 RepID=UPI00052FFBF8|nr:uncharacterized protein LOC104582055 [Brachypodium distachyon]|eukprot:XP_010229647.1 uncharacterized protein LOC104582055 [Brachypodium distachyon]